ncbi:MAG: DUF4174 domain-containing protein [Desulfobacteraceae bacterium]|jgi:hypothetical protein|nr:DUF4174 domain-containing protein [Desulfobacteraceae bacterium]
MPKPMMVVLTAALACSIFGGQKALSMDLNQFQWKNRLLFIFAPDEGDAFFQALQSEISTQPDEISERDLVVFSIFETGPSYQDNSQIDTRTAAAIRTRFAAPRGNFSCFLVGKDGGIKLRQDSQVKLGEVFDLIDAMPMRREEMRQKSPSDESNTTN